MKLSPLFKEILPYLILTTFGFLLYYQTLFFDFVYLDDNRLIIDNFNILREASIFKIFSSDVFLGGEASGFYYRPLLNISFLVDGWLAKTLPFFFHFTNLFLHLLSVILVFFVFKKHFFSLKTALFLSLVFLTHPVLSQAVAWIPGRNDSLLTVFVLASFALFLSFLKKDKLVYLWWHLFFLTAALFTKETAIFLPIICVAYYFLFDHKFSTSRLKDNILIILAGWLSVAVVWYLFRKISLPANNPLADMFLAGWHNLSVLIVYLGKIVLPFNLAVYPTVKDSIYWLGIFGAILLAATIYVRPKINWRRLSFASLWFMIFLLPTLLNADPSLEHRLYLPMIGFLLALGEVYPLKSLQWSSKKSHITSLFIVFVLASLTFYHSQFFKNRMSFWREAVINSPHSAFVNNNLGAMYQLDDDLDAAKHYYTRALELDDKQALVHNNLGLIAVSQNNYNEAEQEYFKEIKINPYYDNVWVNLGILYIKQARTLEAERAFLQAYQLNYNNKQAYDNLLILSSKVE